MASENKFKIELKYISVIVLAIVIFSFAIAGATLSRYVTETTAKFDDGTEVHEYLDFTVNSVYEVKNQMELFAAINQGYSFIRLSQDIENPLIVTQKAETLDSDLILDLNGIEIQRNGYEPILNIKTGVRLTVVDTSDEQTGGLYNPVGSVFNIAGGTLTIATGHFESGPRYSEYYSYNTNVVDDEESSKRTLVLDEEQEVHYHERTASGEYTDPVDIHAPIIKSYPQVTQDVVYTHGNLYFDHGYLADENGNGVQDTGEFYIPTDTYCYYRTSEDIIDEQQEMYELSCDWYYCYWVDSNYEYICAEESELIGKGYSVENCIEIAIYGYENAIEHASLVTDPKNYYAAVQMSGGNLEVQNGKFYSYFGLPNTACVNSTGGTINIVSGAFSSRIPNAYDDTTMNVAAVPNKEDDTAAFDDVYFDYYQWNTDLDANTGIAEGALAMAGESYCILNSGNATVSIDNGQFYSSNNNNLHMGGGSLTVGGGSFAKQQNYKNATVAPTSVGDKTACVYMANGALDIGQATYTITGDYNVGVFMIDGQLSIHDAFCSINGDYSAGVVMADGKLTIDNADYTISGESTYGIYSTVPGDDNFVVNNSNFILDGGINQTGIYVKNGRVNLTSTSSNNVISLSGDNSIGINADTSGSVYSTGYSYSLAGNNSTGINSTGGSVRLIKGNITLDSNETCYGVHVNTDETIEMYLESATIDVGYTNNTGLKAAGNYDSSVGVYLSTNETNNKIQLHDSSIYCYEIAIAVKGGSLELTGNGTDKREIKTRKASAMVVIDGDLTFDGSCDYTVESYAADDNYAATTEYSTYTETVGGKEVTFQSFDNDFNIKLDIYSNSEVYPNLDGVYISGGNFIANGNMNISHTGQMNDNAAVNSGSYVEGYNYITHTVKSFAVRILEGNCTLTKGAITANVGGGVYCKNTDENKEVVLGAINADNSEMKVLTKGEIVGNSFYGMGAYVGNAGGWLTNINLSGGHAVLAEGGNVTINSGTYRAEYGNGVYVKFLGTQTGEVTVYDGSMFGGMNVTGKSGPSACYGLNVNGGATVNIYGGNFDGDGGGALVTGINSFTNRSNFSGEWAEVYVYEGTFANSTSTDGFYVLDKAKVALGAYTPETAAAAGKTISSDLIRIYASTCAISVNQIGFGSGTDVDSYVYSFYGTYGNDGGSRDTAWNQSAFSWVIAYNATVGNNITGLADATTLVKIGAGNKKYITYGNKFIADDDTEFYTYYTTLYDYTAAGYSNNIVYFDDTYFFDDAEANFQNVGKAT